MTVHKSSLWSAVLVLALATPPATAAELVVNGDFESGSFSGWTQSGNTGYTTVEPDHVISGAYTAWLGPIGSLGFLSQTLATVVGQSYALSFDFAGDAAAPGAFSVSIAGKTLFTIAASDYFEWGTTHIAGVFVAENAETNLTFAFQQDPAYWYLDNVSVTTVPGPVAAAGLPGLAALLGFAGLRRQRRSPTIRPA